MIDEIKELVQKYGKPASQAPNVFWPNMFSTPIYTSQHLGIDVPIDYSKSKWYVKLRLKYESFLRRIGAEIHWTPLPLTRRTPSALQAQGLGLFVSPSVYVQVSRVGSIVNVSTI